MSVSNLVTSILPADKANFTQGRQGCKISEITIHHMAGNLSIEALGKLWQNPQRKGSSHYGVNGCEVGMYVSEGDTAWTNSDWQANCRAITIETANDSGAPDWHVSDKTIQTLIRLVADIAKRNNLGVLEVGKNITYHSMYAATACPGPYLFSKLNYIVQQANILNKNSNVEVPPIEEQPPQENTPVGPPIEGGFFMRILKVIIKILFGGDE